MTVQVTSFGTPAMVRATSGSVTGSVSGLPLHAGDVLVALVSAGGTTASAAAISTPSGWTQQAVIGNTTSSANAWAAVYTKVAAGSDSAPAFTATLTGTVAMTCTVLELAAANCISIVDTSGTYSSGGTAGTLSAMAATTAGNVTQAGEYAVTVFCQEAAAATNSWNVGSGWTNTANDGATSSVLHTAVDSYSNPTSGSTLAETGHWTTDATAYGAGIIVVFAPTAGGIALFTNQGAATISSGGTDAPAAGTPEFWTAASWAGLPTASQATTPPTHFHIADTASGMQGEEIAVLNTSTGLVVRGGQGSTPVAHSSGFQAAQVYDAGAAGNWPQYYNVRSMSFGAKGNGATDDTAAIQAALTACRLAGGGIVYVPEGTYLVSSTLLIGSNTFLWGPGMATVTIRMKSGSWSAVAQNASNGGISCLQAYGAATGNITIRGITFDGNETGVTAIPTWSDASECSPLALRGVTNVTVDACQVINAIGYTLYLFSCADFTISNNRVTSGQVTAAQGWGTPAGQDGIHVSASQYGTISGNIIATGNGTAGDDAIALQSWGTGALAIVGVSVTGNIVTASSQSGIDLALSGGPISAVAITGNTIQNTRADGIILQPFSYAATTLTTGVTIAGNTLANVGTGGTGYNGITAVGYASNSLGTGNGWADLVITGNTLVGFNNSGQLGMFLTEGSGLQVNQNAFDQWIATNGIEVGSSGGPTGVTNFQVSGNTINMSAGTDAGGNGILVQESQNGTVSGNVVIGPTPNGTGSAGVNIGSGTTACTGIVVSGNRISGWDYGASEYNGGVVSDYNQFTGNTVHGCTTPVSTSGPHTLFQAPVTDVGGITDSEQFQVLSSARTLTANTSAQAIFNATTNGALTVAAATTYFFEILLDVSGLSKLAFS